MQESAAKIEVIDFMVKRIKDKVKIAERKRALKNKATEQAKEDEKQGKQHTYYNRAKALGVYEMDVNKTEIKDTLKMIRKLTLEIEKEL